MYLCALPPYNDYHNIPGWNPAREQRSADSPVLTGSDDEIRDGTPLHHREIKARPISRRGGGVKEIKVISLWVGVIAD